MTEALVFIHLPSQITGALEALRRRRISDYSVVALTPQVEFAMETMGLPFRRPEDYHTEADIHDVGLRDMAAVSVFCDAVDDYLQNRWDLLREHGIQPARMCEYLLKILFNSVSIRAFITRRILEVEGPKQVFYFETRPEHIPRELFFVRESVWASVIPLIANALGIFVEAIGKDSEPILKRIRGQARGLVLRDQVKVIGRQVLGTRGVRFWHLAYAQARRVRKRFQPGLRKQSVSARLTVLTLEMTYNLKHLVPLIEAQDKFDVLHWDLHRSMPPVFLNRQSAFKFDPDRRQGPNKRALQQRARAIWTEARTLPELRNYLHFSGVDCFPVMERRLQRFFKVILPEIINAFLEARSLLKSVQPCIVLSSTMGDYRHQAMALATRQEGVPFVVYEHGATRAAVQMKSGFLNTIEHMEFRMVDYLLVFGQGDVSWLEQNERLHTQIVPVGSASLDEIRKREFSSERDILHRRWGLNPCQKTVMYVPSSMDGNIRVAPHRNRSPSRAFELERRIVEVFSEFPHVQLVVKLQYTLNHPDSPIAQLIDDRHLQNVIVIREPFQTVLPMADLFITDYLATSFLEMLTTDRPIVVCGHEFPWPWVPGEWHPSLLEMWKERVAYVDDLEEFLERLRTYLREELFQPVRSSDTLLKLFGTHLDDGKSADRAYAFLESLANESLDRLVKNEHEVSLKA